MHTRALIPATLLAALTTPALAQNLSYTAPTFDRWNYPFNSQGGAGTEAMTFGVLGALGLNQFDDRDAQFLTSWITAADVTPGLGAASYEILSARMTATIDPRFGNAFTLDTTPDPWQSYLDVSDPDYIPDADAGRPINLYTTGFRNGFNAFSFNENGPFALANPTLEGVRNAYARGLDGSDNSNHIRDRFQDTPIATGLATVGPGNLVPGGDAIEFILPVNDSAVQAYLQNSLNAGILAFTTSSLHEGSFGGPPSFPVFITKESTLPGATFATLDLTVRIVPAPATALALLTLLATPRRRR